MVIRKKAATKEASQGTREKTRKYLEKIVKKILRQAQHGHIESEHLSGAIARKLHSKGYRLHSRVAIERPRESPDTLCAKLMVSRSFLVLGLTVTRTHSIPLQESS